MQDCAFAVWSVQNHRTWYTKSAAEKNFWWCDIYVYVFGLIEESVIYRYKKGRSDGIVPFLLSQRTYSKLQSSRIAVQRGLLNSPFLSVHM